MRLPAKGLDKKTDTLLDMMRDLVVDITMKGSRDLKEEIGNVRGRIMR